MQSLLLLCLVCGLRACSDVSCEAENELEVSFLQSSVSTGLGTRQASVAANMSASKWQKLMSPKDCVTGKSEQDSQTCHLENLNALASAHFSDLSPASVSLDDFEDAFNVITRAGLSETACCVVQVINNTVWEVGNCAPQNKVFSTLLDYASSLPDVGIIPDVEMHVCDHDHTALLLPANGIRVPVLAPASVPEGRGYMIPVPLNHRRGQSSESQVLKTPDMSGYYDICLGRTTFDSTDFGRMLAGERQCLPHSATTWPSKKGVAFFRGAVYSQSQNCTQCMCRTDDGSCYDCSSVCHREAYGLPCARPRARTQCLRPDLFEALGGREDFDVTNTSSNYVDECMWELNKYLLVIGNNIGWADRVQDSLFKTSATILVDSGAYEWFYPLMIEDLHFIQADPTVASISDVVRTAIERDDMDMTRRANAFAKLIFGIDNVARYTALVAKEYGRLQAYKPQRRAGVSRSCDGYASINKGLQDSQVHKMLKDLPTTPKNAQGQ